MDICILWILILKKILPLQKKFYKKLKLPSMPAKLQKKHVNLHAVKLFLESTVFAWQTCRLFKRKSCRIQNCSS